MFPKPKIKPPSEATGVRIPMAQLYADSGVKCFVTTYKQVDVRLHDGTEDFMAEDPETTIKAYCLAESLLPIEPRGRARYILEKLAYQFWDWEANASVEAHKRKMHRARVARRASAIRTRSGEGTE